MKLTALITAVTLGTSSLALAGTGTIRDHRDGQMEPYYEPAYISTPRPMPTWTSLGTLNQITDGVVHFDAQGLDRISTLRLASHAGKTRVIEVTLFFANGYSQLVRVEQYLNATNPSLDIDIRGRGRNVVHVSMKVRNARSSSFSVLAI